MSAIPRLSQPGPERERQGERPPRPRPQEAPRPRRRRARVRLGRLAIPLIAALVAGIVWVNVAKLGLSTRTGDTVERARAVQAETVQLKARLERIDSEVVDRARVQLGMIPATADSVTYLELPETTP